MKRKKQQTEPHSVGNKNHKCIEIVWLTNHRVYVWYGVFISCNVNAGKAKKMKKRKKWSQTKANTKHVARIREVIHIKWLNLYILAFNTR